MKRNENKQLGFDLCFSDLMCGIAVIFMMLFFRQYNESKDRIFIGRLSHQIKENPVLSSGNGISMRAEDSDIVLVLDSTALFEPFSFQLKENYKRQLNEIIPELVKIFKENADLIDEIRIEGHTAVEEGIDETQDYCEGLVLSQKRAYEVLNYMLNFVEDKDILSRMISVGYSNSRPIFDENGNENKTLSRRVEIRIKANGKNAYTDV